eukprot:1161195-Pelagomonas_calceolata.AAC.26
MLEEASTWGNGPANPSQADGDPSSGDKPQGDGSAAGCYRSMRAMYFPWQYLIYRASKFWLLHPSLARRNVRYFGGSLSARKGTQRRDGADSPRMCCRTPESTARVNVHGQGNAACSERNRVPLNGHATYPADQPKIGILLVCINAQPTL